jgi:glycosyltransferase involved in cell wall biosynthesis
VVADDASTDQTRSTLDAVAASDARVKVFYQKKNLGVANWTYAVAQTCGDFIAWCSDDDRFLPGHLEASVAYLKTHPDVGLVHSSFIDSVETGTSSELLPRPLRSACPVVIDSGSLLAYMTRYYDWPFHPSTFVMRREVWEQTSAFDPAYQVADTDWFVRVAERFRIALLPRHGVINRRHADNWSNRQGSAAMQRELFEIVERAITRRWPRACPRRTLWRAIWRANVRLRLALTLRARLKTGHVVTACAAWQAILQGTGRSTPAWIERGGFALIRCLARRGPPAFENASQSVSPL